MNVAEAGGRWSCSAVHYLGWHSRNGLLGDPAVPYYEVRPWSLALQKVLQDYDRDWIDTIRGVDFSSQSIDWSELNIKQAEHRIRRHTVERERVTSVLTPQAQTVHQCSGLYRPASETVWITCVSFKHSAWSESG